MTQNKETIKLEGVSKALAKEFADAFMEFQKYQETQQAAFKAKVEAEFLKVRNANNVIFEKICADAGIPVSDILAWKVDNQFREHDLMFLVPNEEGIEQLRQNRLEAGVKKYDVGQQDNAPAKSGLILP